MYLHCMTDYTVHKSTLRVREIIFRRYNIYNMCICFIRGKVTLRYYIFIQLNTLLCIYPLKWKNLCATTEDVTSPQREKFGPRTSIKALNIISLNFLSLLLILKYHFIFYYYEYKFFSILLFLNIILLL